MARLTAIERAERDLTGGELQKQVTDLAELMGWSWCHWRAARERGGYRVPVDGPLGEGWPDLFLAHEAQVRTMGLEIKRERGDDPTPAQLAVHAILRAAGMPVFLVRPSDLRDPIHQSRIYAMLARGGDRVQG